ncbi:ADP-ribosylglycohydrolase family protein [Paenibacillus sp. SYP-B3998]|uniref:ADP-ribosylglycohydrolase family protein n=1 Tax=Paenibacillus sp. SYP-B3998 TaxID=2678564 RepID=UPI0031F9985C
MIRRVLSSYEGNWFESAFLADLDLGLSAGNGSLMRCLPIGLCYPKLSDIEHMSRMQSKMTHYDERCNEACEIYNRIVHRLLNNEDLLSAIENEVMSTRYAYVLTEDPNCEPSGFVVHTFNWIIHILTHTNSFAEVVQQAANLGGDTDTIAAIAGGIAGVYYGYEGIPRHYSKAIIIKNKLDSLSERIVELRETISA